MNIKLCKKGVGKAIGFEGCYERKKRYKYGLCAGCFQEWVKTTEAGQKHIKKPKINPVSKQRQSDDKMYAKLRKQFLKDNPQCAVTGKEATEVHHMAGKIGSLYLDTNLWLSVCREAHRQIEENPLWAKENGYSVSRLANDKS